MKRFLIVHPDGYLEFVHKTREYSILQVDEEHQLARLIDTENGYVIDLNGRNLELDYSEASYLLELLLTRDTFKDIKRYSLVKIKE